MSDQPDSCPACGHWTEAGKQKLRQRAREHPIFGTDLSQPNSVVVERVRDGLAMLRGQLGDLKSAAGWDDRLDSPIGGLTCVLIALHDVAEEMRDVETRRPR